MNMRYFAVGWMVCFFALAMMACDPEGTDNPSCEAPESEEELCGDWECGTHRVVDSCGDERQVSCGGCEAPDRCVEGMCRCDTSEGSQTLCAQAGLECGQAQVVDSCGEEREIECGSCTSPYECTDNQCVCEPESESELCATLDEGVCGTQEFTDRCGDTRQVECTPCVEGSSTLGAVRDGLTGEYLEGAEVRIYSWPPAASDHYNWAWPSGYRFNDPDFFVTTTGTQGGANFEIAANEALCLNENASGALTPRQWYRIHITRPGYEPSIYYREHGAFRNGDCPTVCPTSSASGCHFMDDLHLWPENEPYPMYPNLFVDTRDMEDYEWQCALLPEGSSMEQVIGLRVRLGGANVGQGPLHLEATAEDGGKVVQYVHWSDGTIEEFDVESSTFEVYDPHNHIHFMEWFAMRLVEPIDSCRDVLNRAESCVTHSGSKISYCLHDYEPVDGDVMAGFGGESPLFANPPTCDTAEQGITQGWKDTYRKRLPGQLIIIGSPATASALGEQWIEAEIDPERVLQDGDRSSKVARLLVTAPSDASALCEDPATIRDCRGSPADFDADQRRQCGDYLNYVN